MTRQSLIRITALLLPYAIAVVGFICSAAIWYGLVYKVFSPTFTTTLIHLVPWIALALGISMTLLCAIAVRLIQVIRQRSASLDIMGQDVKKEIAERIKAEETKRKLEIALLQGQKLQAIGTLAGGIAHDFNNILYAIKGYVEMAREDVAKESVIYKNLGKVLEASRRGQDLVARILTFGRSHQHHEFEPIQIQTTLQNVLSLLKPTIPASVTINLINKNGDYVILGNQTQLHQVIVNIINNAVDAMEDEGTVTIELNRMLADDDYLKQFPDTTNKNYCKIDIADTGYGMDISTMERIFEPFYTTKEVGKGTGLGLATVHAIIKEHQGQVTVKSQLGRGTMFTLLLPEYQQETH
jgi:signal transduction histidine kinase